MTPNTLIRDAYRELDDTGFLSSSTSTALLFAGIDPVLLMASHNASMEIQD